jgi:hypothetical protein
MLLYSDASLAIIAGAREKYPNGKKVQQMTKSEESVPKYFSHCIFDDQPVEGGGSLHVCRDVQENT